MTCKDVMTADPGCCLPNDTVARAAEIMRNEDVGPVPVVNDSYQKRLAGIVTDRDIAIKVVAAGLDPRTTRVDQIMSHNLITCGVEDDYQQALSAMARHQVRRIPVVDNDGSLVGIISQADVARQSSEGELGHVVEEISEPAGIGHSLRSFTSRSSYGEEDGSGFNSNTLLMGAACLGIGAGIMYLLDPDRGRSRRARARDKAVSFYTDSGYYAGKVRRDLRNRASGLVAEARSAFRSDDEVADQKLEARVRARLGRVTSHPHAIHVRAENGRVTLEGPALASEADGIVSCAGSVSGVTAVENRLETHENAGNIPGLQGGEERQGERWEFMQSNWSPAARVVASAIGGGLAIYGFRARGPLAKTTATVGLGLLTRGVLNKEVSSLTDLSAARRAVGF